MRTMPYTALVRVSDLAKSLTKEKPTRVRVSKTRTVATTSQFKIVSFFDNNFERIVGFRKLRHSTSV